MSKIEIKSEIETEPKIEPKTEPKIEPDKIILFIDDEYIIRQIVQVCVENFSKWKIKLSPSCEMALATIVTEKPDAILLDLMMPNMDGLTFFKKLQADAELAKIPVVLLTSCTDITAQRDFTKIGFKGVIDKPFEPIALTSQIAHILGW